MEMFGAIGYPLAGLLIAGLVGALKRSGKLSGNWLLAASLFLGVLFGVPFEIAQGGVSFQAIFSGIVYGLLLGLATSKTVDVYKDSKAT